MRIGRIAGQACSLMVVAGLGLGGVAGASVAEKQKPLSKKAFVKAADDICRQADVLFDEIIDEHFADLPEDQEPEPAEVEAFVEDVLPILEQEFDSIGALPAPKADKKKIKALLDTAQDELDALADDPSLAYGDPLEKSGKLARKYGFKVCGD
jgi:hypothetical protein